MKEAILISLVTLALVVVAMNAIPSGCVEVQVGENLKDLDTDLSKEIKEQHLILKSLQD